MKRIIPILVFLLFLTSFALADTTTVGGITVTDLTNSTQNITQQQAQNFAQINAKISDLTTQITTLQQTIATNYANTMLKSDLPKMYEQIAAENKAYEVNVLIDNIVIATLCFCVILIFIAKNMFPAYRKEKPQKELAPTAHDSARQRTTAQNSNNSPPQNPIIMNKPHNNENPSTEKKLKIIEGGKTNSTKKIFKEKYIHEQPYIPQQEPIPPTTEEVQ